MAKITVANALSLLWCIQILIQEKENINIKGKSNLHFYTFIQRKFNHIKRRAVYYQNVNLFSPYNVLFSGFKSAINIRHANVIYDPPATSVSEWKYIIASAFKFKLLRQPQLCP